MVMFNFLQLFRCAAEFEIGEDMGGESLFHSFHNHYRYDHFFLCVKRGEIDKSDDDDN